VGTIVRFPQNASELNKREKNTTIVRITIGKIVETKARIYDHSVLFRRSSIVQMKTFPSRSLLYDSAFLTRTILAAQYISGKTNTTYWGKYTFLVGLFLHGFGTLLKASEIEFNYIILLY
jgi:hypothetical protein